LRILFHQGRVFVVVKEMDLKKLMERQGTNECFTYQGAHLHLIIPLIAAHWHLKLGRIYHWTAIGNKKHTNATL
jgi:hypothetical protein